VSPNTRISRDTFVAHFDGMIDTPNDPDGYGVWSRARRGRARAMTQLEDHRQPRNSAPRASDSE